MQHHIASLLATAGVVVGSCVPVSSSTTSAATGWETSYTASDQAHVAAAAATALTSSPTSHVPGLGFDRIMHIWLENTDFSVADSDRK